MKKLMVLGLFLLAVTTLPVSAGGVATIEKIQGAEGGAAAKNVAVTRAGKEVAVPENGSLELNDVLSTANNAVTLKVENGSMWSLAEKTKLSMLPAQDKKSTYGLLDGAAEYKAGEKQGEIIVKINDKDYLVSAGAKVSFSYAAQITSLVISEGTVKFGKLVFDKSKPVRIDAQGKEIIDNAPKMRGIRS